MQHDILALAGPDAPTRQALYDFVMESLQALETLDAERLQPVRQRLVNQRDTLLAFATRLDQALDALAQRFAVPVFRLRQVLALQELTPTTPTYWSQRAALASTRSTASSMLSTRPSWVSAIACPAPAPWWRTSSSSAAQLLLPAPLDAVPGIWTSYASSSTTHPSRAVSIPSGSGKLPPSS
jgi:hypothetical protein